MTTHESFKRRIRERMAKTGERYGAARRALLPDAPSPGAREWAVAPTVEDAAVRTATGRGWDEWTDGILAGPGRGARHADVAAWLREQHGVDPWWAQSVTVGVERILGIRLPGQMPDGTFTISRSRTIDADAALLRSVWDDDHERGQILPGLTTVRRSRAGVKVPRYTASDADGEVGTLTLAIEEVGGRARVVLTHDGITALREADGWKDFWSLWLDDLAAALV